MLLRSHYILNWQGRRTIVIDIAIDEEKYDFMLPSTHFFDDTYRYTGMGLGLCFLI